MSSENSYLSRFFVKFVEVSAAGLASAICAYALAHFGGLLSSSPTPASAPAQTAVQVSPTASEVAGSLSAQPPPPTAAQAARRRGPDRTRGNGRSETRKEGRREGNNRDEHAEATEPHARF